MKMFGEGVKIIREAKNTLTPVEMNKGDTLIFKLKNGEKRILVLQQTAANVIITNLNRLKKKQPGGGTLYHFTCEILIDGHPMTMERYVGSQESFYEPYVINGMRIWFDGVSAIFEKGIVNEEHGTCKPNKDARFALLDMTDNICPSELYSWYINKENFIKITDCYNGDDCWMGAHQGVEAHGGLDINMPISSPNFTPIPIDDHCLFNSLTNGDDNNRWRGVHRWDNGDVWTIQNHHILNLLIPEHSPAKSGIHYADAAGVLMGFHSHAHYVFCIKTPENGNEILLDPWIIFWQAFRDNKKRAKEISASIAPLNPRKTGTPVYFKGNESTSGLNCRELSYYWTFGDGGWSNEANPFYTYMNPGIYPVTLVVDDGAQKASFTQHITIDGTKVNSPCLTLSAKEEPSFRIRQAHVMDVYGVPVQFIPHSLHFVARATRPKPNNKTIMLHNIGAGVLSNALEPKVLYSESKGWLSVEREGKGNEQQLIVAVDATGLTSGIYSARVQVECPGAFNSIQNFLVQLAIPSNPPAHEYTRDLEQEIIDNSDIRYNRFYNTPYFWVAPQFQSWDENSWVFGPAKDSKCFKWDGYNGSTYLTNGGRAAEGEFCRFTPDLEAGKYEVSFAMETPFEPERRAMSAEGQQLVNPEFNPDTRFAVRINSKTGDQIIWMEPAKSRIIGTFEFYEGMDGYVDILSAGSTGQVLVDAIIFKKAE
jgi:PKD repeat protein